MPGKFRKISSEEKSSVMTAVQTYLDQNWSFNSAYNQVKADFLAEEKSVPASETVRRWFIQAGRTETPETPETPAAPPETPDPAQCPSGPSGPSGPSSPSVREAQSAYTRRLELIVKLYRLRSEDSIDAVCDELLPELLTQEDDNV